MRGVDISIIDNDMEMIQAASQFGFKVYYGDGTRLDILHAAGAGRAQAVLICVEKAETILTIANLVKSEFPIVQIYARAYDRGNTIELIKIGVDYQMRETFESALVFGENTLVGLGVDRQEAADIIADVRRRDAERLDLQLAGGHSRRQGSDEGQRAGSGATDQAAANRPRHQRRDRQCAARQARRRRKLRNGESNHGWRRTNDHCRHRPTSGARRVKTNGSSKTRNSTRFAASAFSMITTPPPAANTSSWVETAEGALALMILLDQFPRNFFRGTGTYVRNRFPRTHVCQPCTGKGP